MKKTLALLLTFVMLLSALALTSCGSKSPEELILGKWEGTVKGEIFGEQIEEEIGDMADYFDFKKLPDVKVYLEFDDGEVKQTIDEDSTDEFMEEFLDLLRDGMKEYVPAAIKAQTGQTLTFDQILAAAGQTEEEFWETALEEVDVDKAKEEMFKKVVQEYEFDGDKLLVDDEETFYKLTEKELVIKILDTKVTFEKVK